MRKKDKGTTREKEKEKEKGKGKDMVCKSVTSNTKRREALAISH